jgi:hypothetical protein|tara:strand:+ start:95 stop:526 length:432 start_codon:yes stop_codon:yes gene_type:complete
LWYRTRPSIIIFKPKSKGRPLFGLSTLRRAETSTAANRVEEMGEGGGDHQRSEREELDLLSDEYAANNPFASLGPIAEEMDELRKKGRPLTEEANQKAKGKSVRDRIRNDLSNRGLARPSNARVSTTDRHNREVETREQQILT